MPANPKVQNPKTESSPDDPPMRLLKPACRATLTLALVCGAAAGQKLDFNGQASGWLTLNRDTSYQVQTGVRYIPNLSTALPPYLDGELSVNGFVSAQARSLDSLDTDRMAKPYRAWARFSTARLEARAGLQKINFGSATLLRPLQWFDRIDPHDPLGLTDGVYGLLGRCYFQNNANLWAWSLIGNSSPKGWEQIGSERWTPEFGGRAQLSVPRGEIAATYHHRTVDYSQVQKNYVLLDEQDEDRLGVDAKADIGIGLWLEGILSRTTHNLIDGEEGQPVWTRAAVVGADYTLGVGNGVGLLAEHMVAGGAAQPFGRGTDAQVSALMLSYPLSLLDNIRGFVYFDWKNQDLYRFVGWERTLDSWVFSAAVFWNPDRPQGLTGQPNSGAAGGKGLQLMVAFNH